MIKNSECQKGHEKRRRVMVPVDISQSLTSQKGGKLYKARGDTTLK